MAVKVHLHANFPYIPEVPNAALGYLKSAVSDTAAVKNVYWYLPPREVQEPLSSLFAKFKERPLGLFGPPTYLIAYFSRYFNDKTMVHTTAVDSLINSYTTQQKVADTAHLLKEYIDYVLDNENMADVDVAGFTVNFYQWILNSYIWAKLKKLNPNITIVVGGLGTKEDAEAFMQVFDTVDYCIYGEGEMPLKKLVTNLDDTATVPRLVCREGTTLTVTAPDECRLKPAPFADHTDYFNRIKEIESPLSPVIPLISARSCRWNRCKFCRVNEGVTYYEKPIKDVIEELEYQCRMHNINKIYFVDTDFGRKKKEEFETLLLELLKSVDKRKNPYEIWATASPTVLTRKNVEMMSKIRIDVQIGFEALTDSLLTNMDKMHRFAENIQALKFGKDHNMDLHGLNVIRNLPGEKEKDVIESMENLHYVRFFIQKYHLHPSELTLFKRSGYYDMISAPEREEKWVVNALYDEIEQAKPLKSEYKWDFFGFRAKELDHHVLWDQFNYLLEQYQQGDIEYKWVEFSDGCSLIEEYNSLGGVKRYRLNTVETDILKICDEITSLETVLNAIPADEEIIQDAVSQLRWGNLLYADERGRLISVVSVKNLKKIDIATE
jgi:radical SAM superfamily enzyme YgiQ (UPF0313 family)